MLLACVSMAFIVEVINLIMKEFFHRLFVSLVSLFIDYFFLYFLGINGTLTHEEFAKLIKVFIIE